jgi:translocon-associated protein subunit alpha
VGCSLLMPILRFRPQDIGLTVWVNLAEPGSTALHSITALNQTVSVVEPSSSWLDPQLLFLWLLIGSALTAGAYFAYDLFLRPKGKKRGPRGSGKKDKAKAVVPADQDKHAYPDVKPYEEEWIPEHHLKSRASKLKKREAGAGVSSAGEEVTSGGEVTSGAETSGAEGKTRRRKSKKA